MTSALGRVPADSMDGANRPRPRVIANFAISADGKVSNGGNQPSLFSSPRDKARLLEIRAQGDALMIGAATLVADSMTMGIPRAELREQRERAGMAAYPIRVICSNGGDVPLSSRVFQHDFSPVLVFSTVPAPEAFSALAEGRPYHWINWPGESLDLERVLHFLYDEWRVGTVVCEGGPRLFRSMLARDLVDELHLTWCPVILGGPASPTLTGLEGDYFSRASRWELLSAKRAGDECFLHYRISRSVPLA